MDESHTQTVIEHPAPVAPKGVPPGEPPASQKPRSRMGWLWLVVLLALAAGAYYYWPKISASQSGAAKAGADKKGGRGGIPPVVTTKALRGDIGVYYTGLGAVTPIYTVTIKSRVDGQLMSVHFKEGDIVKEGDVLAEIDPRPYQVQLEQAEGQLIKDQALLDNARIDLKRYQTLLTQNAIPEQQLATQKALVSQDEGTVKSDQSQIDAAKLNLVYAKITAPITGQVGLRLVDPGNIVHASDSNGMLVIAQIQPISVIFTVAEDQLPAILQKWRGGVHLEVDAFDRTLTNVLAKGTLGTIDNQIDQSTGTLKLRAMFDNKNNALFPNQFVNARLLVEEKRGVVLLPTAAIQRNTNMTYVYLVKPDSTVTVRAITVGTTDNGQAEITSGLQPEDEVVMTGVDKLTEGAKIRIAGADNGQGAVRQKRKAASGPGKGGYSGQKKAQ